MKKRILSILAVIIVCISCFAPTNAFATEQENREYIVFDTPSSRISSDGSFSFKLRTALKSGYFKAKGTSITIQTQAKIYSEATGKSRTSKNVRFFVELHKKSGSKVGSYIGMADNIYGGKQFTGLTKGETYYFHIIIIQNDIDGTFEVNKAEYLKGSGNVSGVTVL